MSAAGRVQQRLRWINFPGALLMLLLQRTPVERIAVATEEFVAASPIGNILRAAVATLASAGAMHSLAGATQFIQSPNNPVRGTVGQQLSVGFTITGSPVPPIAFTINDPLPPGLHTVPAANGDRVDSSQVVITGVPTQAGTFTVGVTGTDGVYEETDTIIFQITGGAGTAPAITAQPASVSVAAGGTATFSVTTTGSPAPQFQWRKNGAAIPGATNATLTLTNVQVIDNGAYSVVVSNSAGAITSNDANLTVTGLSGPPPAITAQPASGITVASSSTVVFSVTATNADRYQWRRDGTAISGATGPVLVLTGSAVITGNYSVVATGPGGTASSANAALSVVTTSDVGRLTNLAIRTTAGTGAQTLIVGFAVDGAGTSAAKPLLIRAVGPSLGAFGLTGLLADPIATVFQGATQVGNNDNWAGDATIKARSAQVGAFGLSSDTSLDAALALSPSPGSYSVTITGKNNGTGLALAEIYDASTGAFSATTPRLVNVSARTQVGTGNDILFAGFVIGGTTAKTVLVRAVGPGLAAFGVPGTLIDPKMQLFSGATVIRENDDWGGDPQLAATSSAVGAFALPTAASKDAVLLVTLPPGSYTAQVSGVNNTTGVALVEVYEVP
jgi:hypothetical protein